MPKGSKAKLIPTWDSQLNISSPVQQIKNQCIPVKFIFTTIVCGNAIQWKEVQNHHPCNRFKTSASQCACSSLKFIFTTTLYSEERCKSRQPDQSSHTCNAVAHTAQECIELQCWAGRYYQCAVLGISEWSASQSATLLWNDFNDTYWHGSLLTSANYGQNH